MIDLLILLEYTHHLKQEDPPVQAKTRRQMIAVALSSCVFLFMTAVGLISALNLYGLAKRNRLSELSAITASEALSALAMSEFKPPNASSVATATTAFANLSLGNAQVTSRAVITHTLPRLPLHQHGVKISWTSLIQHLVRQVQPPRRQVIGWALDTGATNLDETLKKSPGLTVFAPKWLHVDGLNGAVAGSIEPSVVAYAKHLGIQVWAVVDNGFNGAFSHSILQYQDQQQILIKRLVSIALQSKINGINLDFEGLFSQDRWNYAHFVSMLATALHAHNLQLSVDLPPDIIPGDNSGPYNHKAIAAAANEVILMGYDEHWGGDPTPGPTASLPWVGQAVSDMLETGIPSNKLVLGVPFYTQDWAIAKSGGTLSSIPLSLIQQSRILAAHRTLGTWNKALGLHVVSFTYAHAHHVIWVEDNRSLLLSTSLVAQDHLAGAAAWYLGLERPSTWASWVESIHSAIS